MRKKKKKSQTLWEKEDCLETMLTLSCSQAGTDQRVTDRDPARCHEETIKQERGDG